MRKKELHKLIFKIIDKSDNEDDTDFQNLQNFLDIHQYKGNKPELEHFLILILNISMNYYSQPIFFQIIEKILTTTIQFYKPAFSNYELFTIFRTSKPILLCLLKT